VRARQRGLDDDGGGAAAEDERGRARVGLAVDGAEDENLGAAGERLGGKVGRAVEGRGAGGAEAPARGARRRERRRRRAERGELRNRG
jgi:hypothetical protein